MSILIIYYINLKNIRLQISHFLFIIKSKLEGKSPFCYYLLSPDIPFYIEYPHGIPINTTITCEIITTENLPADS